MSSSSPKAESLTTVIEDSLSAAALERASLARSINAHIAYLARREKAVRRDLARLDEIEPLQRTGRLLVAQGSKIPRGASE